MISGAANGGVRVWDVISGECLQHLRGHVKAVSGVTCTAVHLISISLESVLCIWDRSRGECLHRLKGVSFKEWVGMKGDEMWETNMDTEPIHSPGFLHETSKIV